MIERYTRPKMSKIWEDQNKFSQMLRIEILACEALALRGKIPPQALSRIKKAKFNINRIKKIEEKTHHDVIAFLTNVAENVGSASRYIHVGLTSSDILDTALAVMMREAADILIDGLNKLKKALAKKAKAYKNTVCVGRTHGIHAEPTTFGLKMALFFAETERNIERMKQAQVAISVGKISGAVGTYAFVEPSVEKYICRKLNLKPAPISTQILQRDRHAQFLTTIAIVGSSLEKLATEIRNLQKTEVREVEEPFGKSQKGSSAMPHKRNPILCERIAGLARVLRGNALASLENISLWHERDITHSSVERIIIPDSTMLLDYMIDKSIHVISNLLLYPKNMRKNLDQTRGLVFSQRVLLELLHCGLSREEAYKIVQTNAMRVWAGEKDFKTLLLADKRLSKHLSSKKIEACFEGKYFLKNVNKIFKRLGL